MVLVKVLRRIHRLYMQGFVQQPTSPYELYQPRLLDFLGQRVGHGELRSESVAGREPSDKSQLVFPVLSEVCQGTFFSTI